MSVHILGIRHHGPGSARNVKTFLEALQPDIVLVEGPPEADAILSWAGHEDLKPPVAILVYQPDNPQHSCFYPFAEYSPEWQAIGYAQRQHIPVRFMDLPLAHVFALEKEKAAAAGNTPEEVDAALPANGDEGATVENKLNGTASGLLPQATENTADRQAGPHAFDPAQALVNDLPAASEVALLPSPETDDDFTDLLPAQPLPESAFYRDPIVHLAHAAGYDDGERWWEHMFEYRLEQEQVFEAVSDAMQALREELPQRDSRMEQLREAWMRKIIRQAEKEMYTRIAVICGAWHAPALKNMPTQKADNDLLKGLPKVKIDCTWIPWTYSRLSYESGYGAGVPSPGWYQHIWEHPSDDGTRWMALVAKLFRDKQQDTSVAHVLEAVRLANALASLRQYSRPGLEELNEATLSILCNGEDVLMQLIRDELIVSNRIGQVPSDIPKPPLQADIERLQKRLRLPQTADFKDYTLDLRKDTDLERSIFLHRLQLLGVRWGDRSETSGKGTFKEQWRLQWDPSFSVDIIEKGSWGNTVLEATTQYVMDIAGKTSTLREVCGMLESALPAELPKVVDVLIQRINNLAAASGDVLQLLEVVPSLVNITRYGNVRKTDADLVMDIAESMISRICVSLPSACTAVAEDAALELLEQFQALNDAIGLLQHPTLTADWTATLQAISGNSQSAPMIAGYASRLLFDFKVLDGDTLFSRFSIAMSVANTPAVAAAWLEGFLKGSGTLLLLDETLWNMVYSWVAQLENDIFMQILPLLRRTFSNFTAPERKKLGEKVKRGTGNGPVTVAVEAGVDEVRAAMGIPVVMKMLGFFHIDNQAE
ncbi:DUF5682 family protein [Chitinophaga sp. HK235]|uniref:DUF5682 family protein n=1 Tax=Chitinophaga sp. HK235 TaxID=2952571 RepID=UPI00201181D7|nr:DUF5682 family protein [Chitinophaga sp. HK235]